MLARKIGQQPPDLLDPRLLSVVNHRHVLVLAERRH
jgi:hypothetical protein